MEKTINQMLHDTSLIFIFLLCLEMAWNVCRCILTCISSRYYFVIIKEARQTPSIRLSDFNDSAAGDLDQEFQEEMLNEYPGSGHRENVLWYAADSSVCIAVILQDILAILTAYYRSYWALAFWMCLYLGFSIFEVGTTGFLLKRYTNRTYLKRKWGHCAIKCAGCVIFRLYLIWLSHDLLSIFGK